MQEARLVGDEFLALEKYVNLNYLVSFLEADTRLARISESWDTGGKKGVTCHRGQLWDDFSPVAINWSLHGLELGFCSQWLSSSLQNCTQD